MQKINLTLADSILKGDVMKKYLFNLLALTVVAGLPLYAGTPQVISGPGTTTLNSNGILDGVSFVNQNVNESTLDIPRKSTVNKNKNLAGISTNRNGIGNINFTGSGGTTKVYGNVGNPTNYMDTITIGGSRVDFYGNVNAQRLVFSKSNAEVKIKENATFNSGGIVISSPNTLIVEEDKTLYGNISGGGGYVVVNNNSTIIGSMNILTLEFNNEGPGLSQGALINGDVNTPAINENTGTMLIDGNLTLNGASNTIWLRADNAVAVPLQVSGSVTVDGPVTVIYHIPFHHTPRVGTYNVINALGGGTSGQTVNVIMNDPRYISVGSNVNGNIIITTTPRNSI